MSRTQQRDATNAIPDIVSPAFKADPLPACAHLRAEHPVVQVRAPTAIGDAYLVTRYEDAVAALVTLGYTASQATDAVSRVAEQAADAPAEDLVKRALAVLTRPSLVTR